LAKRRYTIHALNGGELSPRVYGRTDMEGFQFGGRECSNFVPRSQGSISMRAGTKYVGDPKTPSDANTRLFDINLGGDDSDVIVELGAGYVRFWQKGNLLQAQGGGTLELVVPYLSDELKDVNLTQRDDRFSMVHPDYPPYIFVINSINNVSVSPVPQNLVPERDFNDANSPNTVSSVFDVSFTGTWATGDLFSVSVENVKNKVLLSVDTGGETEVVGTDGETSKIYEVKQYRYLNDATGMESIIRDAIQDSQFIKDGDVSVQSQGGLVWRVTMADEAASVIVTFDVVNTAAAGTDITETVITQGQGRGEPAWSYPFVVTNGGSWYTCIQSHKATANTEPGVGANWQLYWTQSGSEPYYEAWQASVAWVLDSEYSPWDRGFPSVATFYQQRLVVGGSRAAAATVWGSRLNRYDYFILGFDDNEGYSFDLDTRQSSRIRWLESNRGLLIGTSAGDWVINAGGRFIAPAKVNAARQTARKSKKADPIMLGQEVLYIEQGGRKLRRAQRNFDTGSFVSQDITWASEHLAKRGIKRLALVYVPETIVYMVMDDGTLVGVTYQMETETIAWFQCPIDGVVKDIVPTFNEDTSEDELTVLIDRPDPSSPSTSKLMIESMPSPGVDRWNLDGSITGTTDDDSDPNTTTISGLAHLEGKTVTVLGKKAGQPSGFGFVQKEYVVDTGRIIVDEQLAEYWVGLPYMARFVTNELVGDGYGSITSKRWVEVWLRLYNSHAPLLNGDRVVGRGSVDLMSMITEPKSGEFQANTLGHSNTASLTIEQDKPVPTEVLGVYGQITVGND